MVGSNPTPPPSTPSAGSAGDEFVLPASAAQRRLWFIDGLRPGNAAYNIPAVFELHGALDIDALEQAVADLVRRHEALRTTFRDTPEGLRQVICPDVAGPQLELVDQTGVAAGERPRLQTLLVHEFVRRAFALTVGPLVSVAVLRWSETEHTLLVNVHHGVADGWSMGVLLRELSQLYAVNCAGEESPLPPVEIQYGDYAVWEQKQLDAGSFESQVDYWRQALAGAPHTLELPADRPRPPLKSFEGGVEWLELTSGELAAVRAFARAQQVTPFLVVLAACAVVLGRYGRQEDLLLGTPWADRSRPETESLIGFLTNTVVLRADLSANPTIRELLRRLRDVVAGASANKDLPFDKVVEAVRPERDFSRTPLFQVMVAYQPDPLEALSLAGIAATSLPVHNATAKFDLLLGFEEHTSGLRGMFEYSADLFEGPTIRRMAGHIRTVLAALVSDRPDRRIGELPMLTPAEHQQVVVEWNDTGRRYEGEGRLHKLVETQVALTPDAVAVVFEGRKMSYRELDARANHLAHVLRSRGVGPDVLVGVFAERSFELIVALLGVLKAGGAYVPLDPSYPTERLRCMLEDTRPLMVLIQPGLEWGVEWPSADTIVLEAGSTSFAQSASPPPDSGSPDDLAYVIFTSGSTGRPKGAMNTHRGICNLLLWMQERFGSDPSERVLQRTPFGFDVSVTEFFWPLASGARLVIARPGGHRDPRYLQRVVQEQGITTLRFVPSMLRAFVDELTPGLLGSLRRVLCVGETLPRELQDRFLDCLPEVELHNLYGPTETSVEVTHWQCQAGDGAATVPIGRPVANARIYVLDARLQPVPVGVPGDLYIGGVPVGRGYVNREDLTRERFVTDPFGPVGGRLYASGDMARWRPDGNLEYLGRTDHQVKLRGFRIELGEIEATLIRHPRVASAAVVVREDEPGDQRLVAYVVGGQPGPVSLVEVARAWLKTQLPDYMVPSSLVELSALPVTAHGKLDRAALPAPEKRECSRSPRSPATPTEAVVAGIWAEELHLGAFGTDDDFFDLGGHSLVALRVFMRIQQQFAVTLPLATLFQAPTVARLAAILDAAAPPAGQDAAQLTRPDVVPSAATDRGDRKAAGITARRGLSIETIDRSPCLAAIQPTGSRTPFFVLPGAGGNVLGFQKVARYLDPDQPLIGLESLGRDGRDVPLTNFHAIAARFIQEMRSLQLEGPYALGGISFGGMVALEMAQQLLASGQRVALLALLDTGLDLDPPKHSPAPWPPRVGVLGQRLQRVASALLLGREGDRLGYLRVRARRVGRRMATRRWRSRNEIHAVAAQIGRGRQLPIAQALHHVRQANIQAIRAYRPVHYHGAITLFYATQRDDGDTTRERWRALCDSLTVHPVPGDHTTMLDEPNVRVLARALGEAIEQAHRDTLERAHRT